MEKKGLTQGTVDNMDIHIASIITAIRSKAALITQGSLPAPWKSFLGANGEATPFNFTTTQQLGNRIVQNYRIYGYNYASIALVAGIIRVLLSPSLLFLSGLVVLGWFGFQIRYYEKLRIPEILYYRGLMLGTFVVLCFIGPAALSWVFGIGGSIAVLHACLRNSVNHKDDEQRTVNDDETSSLLESGDVKEKPFVSCDGLTEDSTDLHSQIMSATPTGGNSIDIESMDAEDVVTLVWSRLKDWASVDGKRALTSFRQMDKDMSGTLDFNEFKSALMGTGVIDGVSDEILQKVIESADSNDDGVIQYSEFVHKIKAYSV